MKKRNGDFSDINAIVTIAKALSSEDRVKIIELLDHGNFTINELAEKLNIPVSTAALHVKVLEECGFILTRLEPGIRGTKKVCFKNVDEVYFHLLNKNKNICNDSYYINMPVGAFSVCNIQGTCGLVSEFSSIGAFDNPSVFFYPDRYTAQLIWFESGFLEYRFPLDILKNRLLQSLELSFECCSEAPSYNLNWPSDITLFINDLEAHTFTSPGDFGGRKGKLNPSWWPDTNTQYGLLYKLKLTHEGVYFNEEKVSNVTLDKFHVDELPYLTLRIGIKEDTKNCGGINLFGEKFGDYSQNIVLRIDYTTKNINV